MTRRKQFWMGFGLVALVVGAGLIYVFATTSLEFALELLSGVAVMLFVATLLIVGISMMIDAKVSK